jgi:pimeloyl-ACP methyl ester carboxylesterase
MMVLALAIAIGGGADARAAHLKPCVKGRFRCGTVTVPLDYGNPGGAKTRIAVTRLPARDQRDKLGALFINYGGPGADAVKSTQGFGAKLFASYRKRFDLVAIDPRGTGQSKPALNCNTNQERYGLYRQPYVTPDTADEDADLAASSFYANRCLARNAKLAAHVSTANVARDMDKIRGALGYRRITYFGYSYGTLLGATYAALFPSHLRALVLDGTVDPQAYLDDPTTASALQTAAFERELDRYFAACAKHRTYCRWTGHQAPEAAYDRLVARAQAHPIHAPHTSFSGPDHRPVDGQDINAAIVSDLYAKQLWPEITKALNQAKAGDATLMRALADYFYGRRKHGGYSGEGDRYYMIGATEEHFPTDAASYLERGAESFAAYPHFFFNSGYIELDYNVFTAHDPDAFYGPFTLPKSAPTPLLVGTTFDPATPYSQTQKLADQLGGARILTMRGDGHTAYGGNSHCIDHAVNRYVIALKLPRSGLRCRQTVQFPPPPTATASVARATDLWRIPRRARLIHR